MKHIFIGDIHGKDYIVEKALAMEGHKIFVGDLQDSWDKSLDQHEKCIQLVLDAIRKGEATACLGNHELSYLLPSAHRCSGYSLDRDSMIIPYKNDIMDLFKPWAFFGDFLVTHAGMHPFIYKDFVDKTEQEREDWFSDLNSPCHWIGYSRGGNKPVGGIFWCDWIQEFKPVVGLNQIFGHTARRNGVERRYAERSINYCIDCLDIKNEFLELEI